MTLREQMEERRAELEEFFTWRFSTRKFGGPLARAMKRLDPRNSVWFPALLRWEEAALRLGYRPGKPVDTESQPPKLRGRKDAVRSYYFEREKAQRDAERTAKFAALSKWRNTLGQQFAAKRNQRNQHRTKHTTLMLGFFVVDRQGLACLVAQESKSRVELPMRVPRSRTRSKAPPDARQLDLALDL